MHPISVFPYFYTLDYGEMRDTGNKKKTGLMMLRRMLSRMLERMIRIVYARNVNIYVRV